MHYVPKPPGIDAGREPRPDEPPATAPAESEILKRRAAAACLQAAARADDPATQEALRRRAAELIESAS